MLKLPIFMDHHATTPLDPRVLEAMLPSLTTVFGNASSRNHSFGRQAEKMVEDARVQIAHLIGAESKEIIFTSGTTESINMALKGVFEMYRKKGNHIITQVIEHKAALDTCKYLQEQGAQVTYLPVDKTGQIDLDSLQKSITEQTILISIMFANNEVGTLQPVKEIGEMAKARGVLFHCDAAQAVGKIPINVEKLGIDLLSFSAHKMYGPKGAGALYVREKNPHVRLTPVIHGGGQERGLRPGTLNVPGIVGLGAACEIAQKEMAEESKKMAMLRDSLNEGIQKEIDEVYLNGHPSERLPNNLNLSFAYVDGAALLMEMNKEIAVSSGSACATASLEPSYVLKALGIREDLLHSSVRFGLGRFNTQEEVDYTIQRTAAVVKKLRAISPLYKEGGIKNG